MTAAECMALRSETRQAHSGTNFMHFLTLNAAQMNSSCSEYAVTEHSL